MDTVLPYTGQEFLDSLDDGREVWIYGERIKKIAEHPGKTGARGEGREKMPPLCSVSAIGRFGGRAFREGLFSAP